MTSSIFFVMILVAFCLAADASDNGPIRNEAELAEAMGRLRKKYEPFLQSIPEKVYVRTRRDLCSEAWCARYEMGEGAYEVGHAGAELPPMKKWYGADLDDSNWDPVTVPEWRFKTSRPGGKKRKAVPYGCVLWYRTSFKCDKPSGNKRVFLVFEGVDWTAEVWLNGEKLGSHTAYCEPFRFDVTSLLAKENKLAVRVTEGSLFNEPSAGWAVFPMPTCPPPGARIVRDRSKSLEGYQKGDPHMRSGYGIHREVYLETVGEVRVSDVYARGRPQSGDSTIKVHFVDVNAATWPKSIVSHDLRPKKGYFAMAQMNQPTIALPRLLQNAEVMELWVDNDTDVAYEQEFHLRAYRPKFRPEGEWLRPNERRRRAREKAESVIK